MRVLSEVAQGPPGSDQLRGERTMVRARWVAAVWAAVQVHRYDALPYPDGVRELAWGLVGLLVVGNLVLWAATRAASGARASTRVAAAGVTFEVAVASAFVWLYAFDPVSALWVVLFLVPVAAAARFALPGAMISWAAVAGLYAAREVWAAAHYGFDLSWVSVTFRCGMLGLVALVVGLLTRDLVAERERARELERWRGRMVAMLAHDIRSPLAAASMALEGLDRAAGEDERAALVAVARRQTARVLALARDLLDLAADEQGTLSLRRAPTLLSDVVSRALSYTDPRGEVAVDVPGDLVADIDADRIEQVLVNLLVNAASHGRPPISLTARADDDRTVITVRDHGDGVPRELLRSLFEPFPHPTGDGSDTGSSVGLGLWVAAMLVGAHGGTIDHQPADGGGAVFRIELPAGSGAGVAVGPTERRALESR